MGDQDRGKLIPFPTKGQRVETIVKNTRHDKTQALRRMAALSAEAERAKAWRDAAEEKMNRPENQGIEEIENAFFEVDFEYSAACVALFEHLRTMGHQGVLDPQAFQ